MQIKLLYPFRKIVTLLMVMIPPAITAQAQCDAAANHPRPYMWAPKDDALLQNFKQRKKQVLDDAFHIPQTDSFYLGNFLGMMAYFESRYGADYTCLHIYICAYGNRGRRHIPKGARNKLTLVFAPAKMEGDSNNWQATDLGYFTFRPGEPFNAAKPKSFKLRTGPLKNWHRNFSRNMLGKLWQTVNDSTDDNHEDDRFTDTRAITYCREDLHELIQEQCYAHTIGQKPVALSKDFTARFAAYSDTAGKPRKRLFVWFDFTDSLGHIIKLEDTDGFNDRHRARAKCTACQRDKRIVDNGQLCPPSTNCPSRKDPVPPAP
jgi:hypothetical protein